MRTGMWQYTDYEMMFFVDAEVEKHNDELLALFKKDKELFDKKLRGIVIGVWQKKGAFGRNTRNDMDAVVRGHRDFFLIKNDLQEDKL